MDEQNINTEQVNDAQMYIDQINTLKANSVSKDRYDRLMEENRSLLNSLVNGSANDDAEPEEKPDVAEIRNKLFSGKEMSNLEYCTLALQLRDATLEETGKDIFVGSGHNLTPTQEAFNSAQRVADIMHECIEASNGSSELFTAELMRRTNDITLPKRR